MQSVNNKFKANINICRINNKMMCKQIKNNLNNWEIHWIKNDKNQ